MKLDLLAIAPHPDDVELTCGGTMAKMADAGYSTGILDLTRGETGTRGTPETRLREAARAGKILGVKVRRNLGLPDAHLRVCEEHKVAIAEVIRELEPQDRHTSLLGRPAPGPLHCVDSWLRSLLYRGLEELRARGRGFSAIQDHLCGSLCAGHAHLRRRYQQILREAEAGDFGLRIAIPAAEKRTRAKGELAP